MAGLPSPPDTAMGEREIGCRMEPRRSLPLKAQENCTWLLLPSSKTIMS